jgi:hypothetical protein
MKKSTIAFINGAFLGMLAFIMFSVIYENASNRIEAAQVLTDVSRIQHDIGDALAKREEISDHFYTATELTSISQNLAMLYRGKDGSLILKSSPRGILFWLYPEDTNGKIKWNCYGGSNKDIPVMCRDIHE